MSFKCAPNGLHGWQWEIVLEIDLTHSVDLAPDDADEATQHPPRKINLVGLNRR